MSWKDPLEFHEHFTVVMCRKPGYCNRCNKMIKVGQIKVSWQGSIYHRTCIEALAEGSINVNTNTMKVEKAND